MDDEFTQAIIEAADVFLNGEDSSRNPSNYADASDYAETMGECFTNTLRIYLHERIQAGDYVKEDAA